jgi:mono/diheme cytochrome c family protein
MSVPTRVRIAGLAVIASLAVSGTTRALASAALGRDAAQDAGSMPRSASERAGSIEQAKRGEGTYLDECARCHSETLGGTEFGPALVGQEFVHTWTGKSVGDLFVRVRDTMPVDGPGRLGAQQSVDVVAFILHENKVGVGDQPLTSEAAALKKILINAVPFR